VFPLIQPEPVNRNCLTFPQLVEARAPYSLPSGSSGSGASARSCLENYFLPCDLERPDRGVHRAMADHVRVMRCISFTAQLGRTWKCRAVVCDYARLVYGVIRTDM
jgi:hypothetical protein